MKTLFAHIAAQQGEPLPLARLARILGASDKTTAQLLDGFESLFLIRRHGKGWYCEDMGLAAAACKSSWTHDTVTLRRWVFGRLMCRACGAAACSGCVRGHVLREAASGCRRRAQPNF